jgi:hypothetical protein
MQLNNIPFFWVFIFVLAAFFNSQLDAKTATGSGRYSIQFFSTTVQGTSFQIALNGVAGSTITVPETSPNSPWISFDAAEGDVLSVRILSLTEEAYLGFFYVINNQADGAGTQIYDSKTTTFTPVNTCPENEICNYVIYGDRFDGSLANFYVNNVLVLQNYDGTTRENLNIAADASIRVVFTYGGVGDDIYYYFNNQRIPGDYNFWAYNAFGTNTIIPNTAINPDRPPFGGQYYPITNEEASSFASTIGGGHQNSVFIALTLPIN